MSAPVVEFLHFLAQLIIALALLRLLQAKLSERFGPDHGLVKALAFLD